ncbi:MAG: hypothetical protein K2X74_00500 [Acetobacteraceae bacterium]|nr:hypothetical protein [Acetobacteraceae bacterium]
MAVIDLNPARGAPQVNAPVLARNLGGPAQAMQAQGEALSAFGEQVREMAARREAVSRQREAATADADITEGLMDIRGRQMRNDPALAGDPVEVFRREAAAVVESVASRFGGDTAELIRARGRQTMAGQAYAVQSFATQREVERVQAETQSNLDRLARLAAAETDPLARGQLMAQAEASIAGALQVGGLSAVQAERLRQGFTGSLDQAQVLQLVNRNPGEAARRLADPAQFPNLDPVQRERLFGTAQNAAQAAAARAEAAANRRERLVQMEAGQINGLLSQGIVPEDRVTRLLDTARGTALEPVVRQMVADGRTTRGFVLAGLPERQAMLAEADARRRSPNATDADQAYYGRLAQADQAIRAGFQRDGLGQAVALGLVEPQAPINWADPATLNSRAAAAAAVSERQGYRISPFNREDLAAGLEVWRRGDVDEILGVATAIRGIADVGVRNEAIRHFEEARGPEGRMPPGTFSRIIGMVGDGSTASMMAARRLVSDMRVDISGRARQAGEGQEMNAALIEARGSGVFAAQVAAARLLGGEHAIMARSTEEVLQRAAAARMASGASSASEAVRLAAADWQAGQAGISEDGLAHVWFPASAPVATVRTGLRLLREEAAGGEVDPRLGQAGAAAALARQGAARSAVWVREADRFALVAMGTAGAPVVLRTATLPEVVAAGERRAAEDARRPPVARREDALEQSRRDMRQQLPAPAVPIRPPRLQ